jgi:SpoVK/Ycf46/Vps4 family AAA+-type ATPase
MLSHASLCADFDFEELARRTDGLSGSDLKETCRNAAMIPVRELMREKGGTGIKGMEEAKKEVSYPVSSSLKLRLTSSETYTRVSNFGH